MSLSTLFKSGLSIHAHTSEDFLKLTKKCMERVQKMILKGIMFSPPKFNYDQCKYLADKLKLVVESVETHPPKDIIDCFEIIKLVHGFANVVENFIRNCRQDRWIQAAMTMTSLSEHIASLGFYLEAISQSFLGVLTSTSFHGMYQSEVKIVEEKASHDRESLLKNLNALLHTKPTTWKLYQLATLLLERLQHPQGHKDGSIPRFFHNDKDILKEKEKLGRGAFATVFKASWLGIEVAKKTFYARDSPDFEKEVSILQTLSHPNITSLFGYAKDDQECFMIMELMDEDLFSLIRRRMKENKTRGYPFDIIEAMDMMLQIGSGMKYLHEMRIVHRDLKSMNILVKYVKTRDMKIAYVLAKVSDFGLSRIKQKSLTQSNQTPNMGTARWMAPEMIILHLAESSIEVSNTDANDAKVAKHPFKSDVYSFAMVCYEILSGEMPYFEEYNLNEVKKKVLRGDRPQLPNHCPPDMKSLMKKCWNADASKRPCFIEILVELQQLQCSLLMSRLTFYEKRTPVVNNLQTIKFTLRELKSATKNFAVQNQLAEGGFGMVYKGSIKQSEEKVEVAIKQLNTSGLQGHHEWATEVHFLGMVDNPHLVKLIGYCADDDERGIQRLLVYEYMPNRGLDGHIFRALSPTLSWQTRIKVALGAARGLAYLHEEKGIIFCDFKPGNILLDEEFNPKLSDFGLARQGSDADNTHVTTLVKGTLGYLAPEYMQTGHLTFKSDVFSFGVVLLEILTGRRSIEKNRPWMEQGLFEWVKPYINDSSKFHLIVDPSLEALFKPYINDSSKFHLIVDPSLEALYPTKAAMKFATIAIQCLDMQPKARPKMNAIVEDLKKVQEMTNQWENNGSTPSITLSSTPPETLIENAYYQYKPSRHTSTLTTRDEA